jgi:hypothetical protein
MNQPASLTPLIGNALCIQALSMVTAMIVGAIFHLVPAFGDELRVFVIISLSTWLVLSVWSALYSWRAIRAGEAPGFPIFFIATLLLFTLPTTLSFLLDHSPLDFAASTFFFEFWLRGGAPFYCGISMLGASVALLVTRWKFSTRTQPQKFKLAAWLSLICALPLLPHAFFLHMSAHAGTSQKEKCFSEAADYMPAFIGDHLSFFLNLLPRLQPIRDWHHALTDFGHLSSNGVKRLLQSSDTEMQESAMHCIERLPIEDARTLAFEIASKKFNGDWYLATKIVVRLGTHEQILSVLSSDVESVKVCAILQISALGKREFVPQLDQIARSNLIPKLWAVRAIVELTTPAQQVEYWKKYVLSPDDQLRTYAVQLLGGFPASIRLKLGLDLLEKEPDGILEAFLQGHPDVPMTFWNPDDTKATKDDGLPSLEALVRPLVAELDHPNLVHRRFAEYWLASGFIKIVPRGLHLNGAESAAERTERAEIRASAQKWLDAQSTRTGGAPK